MKYTAQMIHQIRDGDLSFYDVDYEKVLKELDLRVVTGKIFDDFGVSVIFACEVQYYGTGTVMGIKMVSGDIAHRAGIFGDLCTDIRIETFGYAKVSENGLWIPLNMMWEYKSGGTNGTRLYRSINWTLENGWQFEEVGR